MKHFNAVWVRYVERFEQATEVKQCVNWMVRCIR